MNIFCTVNQFFEASMSPLIAKVWERGVFGFWFVGILKTSCVRCAAFHYGSLTMGVLLSVSTHLDDVVGVFMLWFGMMLGERATGSGIG